MTKHFHYIFIVVSLAALSSCSKHSDHAKAPEIPDTLYLKLSYGDSVLYVTPAETLVAPVGKPKGRFFAFPEGIEINELTGEINVNKSETGLRYRISFIPEGVNDTLTTIVLLSGVNYLDRIYAIEDNDTLAHAVYNGSIHNDVPGQQAETVFDDDDGCKNEGIVVDKKNGTINLASLIRNGVLGAVPKDGAQKEVDLIYRLDDGSKKARNKVRVKFYYFDTPDQITQDLLTLVNEREGMFLGIEPQPPFMSYVPSRQGTLIVSNGTLGTAKPRPPCIFIVGRMSRS